MPKSYTKIIRPSGISGLSIFKYQHVVQYCDFLINCFSQFCNTIVKKKNVTLSTGLCDRLETVRMM